MRRKDREITDFEELRAVIAKASVCRVAFFDVEYPYIVPLNFGFEADGGRFTLYFHCASEGKKIELLKHNKNVAFEMDSPDKFFDGDKACYSTMTFESICGSGTLEAVGDDEKTPALKLIMQQYSDKRDFEFDALEVKAVTVLKLTVHALSGKRLTK